jgi:trigger factor
MRVDVESLSNTERKVEVVIPVEEVKDKIEKVTREFQKNAKIRGFRPGKIPRSLVESMFRDDILSEVSSRLVSESFEEALKEVSVTPVSRPRITPERVERDKEFRYTAVFEVVPEFEVKDYTGIELKRERYEVKDEDVDRVLNGLREREAEAKPLETDREVRKGDYVVLDYEGRLNGKVVKDLKKTDVQFLVGEGRLIAEFEENLEGMKKGEEKEFDVNYPEDFQMEEVAGKTVRFKVRVKDVLERVLPELDDEFARDLGHESLEGLKKKIREDLEKRLHEESKRKLKEELIRVLIERNPIEVPPSLVESELTDLKRGFANSFERYGLEVPPIDQETESVLRERAIRNVKISLILGAIAKKEGIEVSEEELDRRLIEISRSIEVPFEKVREVYKRRDAIESLEARLIEEKVFDFLLEKSNIEEVSGGES